MPLLGLVKGFSHPRQATNGRETARRENRKRRQMPLLLIFQYICTRTGIMEIRIQGGIIHGPNILHKSHCNVFICDERLWAGAMGSAAPATQSREPGSRAAPGVPSLAANVPDESEQKQGQLSLRSHLENGTEQPELEKRGGSTFRMRGMLGWVRGRQGRQEWESRALALDRQESISAPASRLPAPGSSLGAPSSKLCAPRSGLGDLGQLHLSEPWLSFCKMGYISHKVI